MSTSMPTLQFEESCPPLTDCLVRPTRPTTVREILDSPQNSRLYGSDQGDGGGGNNGGGGGNDVGQNSGDDSDDSFGTRIIRNSSRRRYARDVHPQPAPHTIADFRSYPTINGRYAPNYEQMNFAPRSEQNPTYRHGFARLPSNSQAPTYQPGHHEFQTRLLESFFNDDPTILAIRGNKELQQFLSNELESGTAVLDLVVLTGLARFPWATTCGEYISAIWPEFSGMIGRTFQWLQDSCLMAKDGRSANWFCDLGPYDTLRLSPLPGEFSCFTKEGLAFPNQRQTHGMRPNPGSCDLAMQCVANQLY